MNEPVAAARAVKYREWLGLCQLRAHFDETCPEHRRLVINEYLSGVRCLA